MDINRIELKARARNVIRTSDKPKIITVSFVFLLISVVFSFMSQKIAGLSVTEAELEEYMQHAANADFDYVLSFFLSKTPPASAQLIGLAIEIVLCVLTAGYTIFLLNSIRRTAPCFENLLDGFSIFWRVIWLNILEGIFIFLWSLLFIIPGIIAAFSYSQAIYLLIDHPEMTPMQCIRESKRMMKGRKGEYFVLELSFIGWALLAAIPIIGYAVEVWLIPFISTTEALYYETLRGADIYSGAAEYPFYTE